MYIHTQTHTYTHTYRLKAAQQELQMQKGICQAQSGTVTMEALCKYTCVYVCKCVCVYICIYTYIYIYIYIYYVCTHACMHACMHACIGLYAEGHLPSAVWHCHTNTYLYTHIYIHTHMFLYIHIDTYIYVYTFIHTYIHTYCSHDWKAPGRRFREARRRSRQATYIPMHIYTYIHIHTYMFLYIHIHHTYIHTAVMIGRHLGDDLERPDVDHDKLRQVSDKLMCNCSMCNRMFVDEVDMKAHLDKSVCVCVCVYIYIYIYMHIVCVC
jgi:hypothetical protein